MYQIPHKAQYISKPITLVHESRLKNSDNCPFNQNSAAAMTSTSDEKGEHILFSDSGSGGSPTGPDPENRVGDQDIGSPGTPVSSGLHVAGETGYCRERTR